MSSTSGYVNGSASMECIVNRAHKWTSLTMTENRLYSDLHVILLSSNTSTRPNSTVKRYDVTHDIIKRTDDTDQIVLKVAIKHVQCEGRHLFKCSLYLEDGTASVQTKRRLRIVGRLTLSVNDIYQRDNAIGCHSKYVSSFS